MLLRLEPATDGKYKYIAHFTDGRKTKFGAKGYPDYTLTGGDIKRRELYRKRHAKDLDTNDPYRAGYLSYYILWGDSTSIAQNVRDYNKRFFK
jgi:hypothetical protein